MRRQTVYPGAVPLETDILNTNKNIMIAIGHLIQDMLGTSTLFSGLGCVPTSPAGMTVNVNPGRAYSYQATDTGAYSSLAADAHQIVKQGILLDAVNLSCPAPTTAGFSQNYLVQAAFQEIDAGSVVLPYYNATNPAQAYSGPNNTGASNTTYRDNTVQVQVKAGSAATTGSQVTPTPDAGFNGLWVVTVPFGATTITSGMIAQYAGAPFLSASLLAQIQAPIPGRLLRTSVYTVVGGVQMLSVNGGTATATGASAFTPLLTSTVMRLKVQGAGGGGGAVVATGSSTLCAAGGGGAGAYGEGLYPAASLAITVGVKGSGSAIGGTTGLAGGSSSAGALISAPGGFGSLSSTTAASSAGANGGTAQSTAPTGANVLSIRGGPGTYGIQFAGISANSVGGPGGSSQYGSGPAGPANTAAGNPGTNPGTGGSGAVATTSSAAQAGAPGLDGIIEIEEYS
jgi:hypothetical protein